MRVELRNIGPINRAALELEGLSLLVGPNASGKTTLSTVCYAVLLSHEAAERVAHQRLWRSTVGVTKGPEVTARALGELYAGLFRENLAKELSRSFSPDLAKLPRRGRTGHGSAPRIIVTDSPSGEPAWCLVFRIREHALALESSYTGYRLPKFRKLFQQSESGRLRSVSGTGVTPVYFPAARSGYVQMQSILWSLLLGALGRGYFEEVSVGKISGVAADFLQFLAGIKSSQDSGLNPRVADRLEQELLHGHLRMSSIDDTARLIEFAPEGVSEYWPMDSAATSVAEIAPLLLYLRHRARPRDLLFIDEPEAHLHPENQIVLAEVLLELSGLLRGMVIGTHSEFFATGISNGLLRRALRRDSDRSPVAVYQLVAAKATGGYEGVRLPVSDKTGFDIAQFSAVAEAALDEAQHLFGKAQTQTS